MRRKAFWGLGIAVILAAYADTASFSKQIPGDERIRQALNRLTFGARPGDIQQVKAVGLKKWIDLQLHPERIPENPVLIEKLKPFDTLGMSSKDLVRNYPAPQIVKQMMSGAIPFPSDPDRRLLIEKQVKRNEAKQGDAAAPPDAPQKPVLADLLSPDEIRSLRTGPPENRLAALEALPHQKQDDVIGALPQGMRMAIFAVAPPDLRRRIEFAAGPAQVVARDLQEAKILRAVYSSRQLEEVLTDFWFNHFNVFIDKGADHYLTTAYERDAIRPHVLGKFRDLLEATAKSPAMLFYLDNWESVGPSTPAAFAGGPNRPKRGLNENYGRELLELHTLGVDGGYTQKDVTEVARCFTGWSIERPNLGGGFRFAPRQHDLGEKVVLGVTIPAGGGEKDGERVLDIVAHSPATAHHISKELAQRFVADDPPAALVERMAQTFLKTDGDLRAVMASMIDSKEFWSQAAFQSKMKSPLEVVVSAVRASNGNVDFAQSLVNQVAQLGEPLYRKIEPTGYANTSSEWMSTAGLMARMNFAVQLSGNKVPGVKVEQTAASSDLALGSPQFQKR
ncbi:MAG TPA: DUF1800 family protein [Bryobacteraceae bacterium]|jgi:uncharacterized protein (DUF1800 family)|nr:DUF1800 family protein [Bryobacteraceae bacterium]